MRRLRIGLAQINTTVGDFPGNTRRITKAIVDARSLGVDLVAFPELAICGYPPEDLVFKPQFIEENLRSLDMVAEQSTGLTVIIGFIDYDVDIFNAAAIIHDEKIAGIYHKIFLPNYGVFDENRYFQAGNECPTYIINGISVGVNVCEDIWYEFGPSTLQAYSGAEVIVNISASPYHAGKGGLRESMLSTRASDNAAILAFANLVGGQDELIFEGASMIFDENGRALVRGKQFEEDLIVFDLDVEAVSRFRKRNPIWRKQNQRELCKWQVKKTVISEEPATAPKPPLVLPQIEAHSLPGEIYNALILGTHDYVIKNGFKQVLIGLSGGIDSSLVATIAVDALGSSNVIGVAMPSKYSSQGSLDDAKLLAENLGIKLYNIPIDKTFQAYLKMLEEPFRKTDLDITEENLQARIRGNILMALSNKFGWLVLTTGNKSEMATGYSTLYGDMAGGFAVIKDVPKTMVYGLASYRNSIANREIIPSTVINKEPSAELRPEQKDSDTLPPYNLLDQILNAYVEQDKSIEQIINMGFAEEVVKQATRLVDGSEYKRRQSPPGVKITPKAFGRDRRLPITNWFKG